MTFGEYISNAVARCDERGDFIRLARQAQLPEVSSFQELRSHLNQHPHLWRWIETGREVWKDYEMRRSVEARRLGKRSSVASFQQDAVGRSRSESRGQAKAWFLSAGTPRWLAGLARATN